MSPDMVHWLRTLRCKSRCTYLWRYSWLRTTGPGRNAFIEGYGVGGKAGTAQVISST